MTAQYRVEDGVAVIVIDNPPVNGLGHAARSGIADGIARAQADAAVTAIVLVGAGRVFSGGADIREFNTPKATQPPTLRAVIEAVEHSAKPVVAAIHGVAMGGGLELALGCHYRVALADAQIALPEVKLGLLPGAGGTQRLPRAIGLGPALAMIVSGDPVRADRLRGLCARTFDDDLLPHAVAFARDVAAAGGPHPRLRDAAVEARDVGEFRAAALAALPPAARDLPAPQACIEALAATLTHGFDDGLRIERAAFERLLASPEAKALRHVFLRRARGRAHSGPAGGDTDARDRPGWGDRRRHDGRGDRDEFRERRNSGTPPGDTAGRARPWRGDDAPPVRSLGAKGQADGRRRRAADGTGAADDGDGRSRRRRPRHRGRVRGHDRQASGISRARRGAQGRRHPGVEHVDARSRPHRGRHAAAAGRGRPPLLQPRQRHATS